MGTWEPTEDVVYDHLHALFTRYFYYTTQKMKPRGKPFGGNRKFQRKGPPKPQAPAPIPEEEEIGLLEQRIRDESPASGTQASR